jgi:beta-lactamase superfamily II metal-dependent hydrolase
MPITRARSTCIALLLLLPAAVAGAQSRPLEIYWVDVEGGAATLVVAPSGESLLVDAGWEIGDRDARRIAAAAAQAGVKKIDHFVLTHFHADHAGGLTALARLLPIERCIDHGGMTEPANERWVDIYMDVCRGKRTTVKAGDRIPMTGVQIDVVASNGAFVTKAGSGGQANPLCATAEHRAPDSPENLRSIGTLFTYGRFTFLDLGDLDWSTEIELSCPVNRLGEVTVYQTSRHGAFDGAGAPAHLHAIRPQVVVVNNGPRKGLGGPSPGSRTARTAHYERIAKTPGIEGIWQGHLSLFDKAHNTAETMIGNLEDTGDCKGHWIRATVESSGRYTLTNGRNGFSRTYAAR